MSTLTRKLSSFAADTTAAGTQPDCRTEFVCPEESSRYAGMLEQMVFGNLRDAPADTVVVEFGSGTGAPIVAALLNSGFMGVVHGYEINPIAAAEARTLIGEYGLARQYLINNASFFDRTSLTIPTPADYLIANPPYLPCETGEGLTLPDLWGGPDGIDISKRLLSCGYRNVFLLISSYSNPAALVEHARLCGYRVSDFQVSKMSFGVYSRQDRVQRRIHEMRAMGAAFFTDNCYLVGGAVFTKEAGGTDDLSGEFLACLVSLGQHRPAHQD